MEGVEEEISMTEEGQGDAGSSEGESGVDMSNSSPGPTKRGRGRPKGSKKLQVWVTHVNLSDLGSDFSNGGPAQPLKRRGRPKGSSKKKTAQQSEQESGDDALDSSVHPQKRRGRPKGSGSKKQASIKSSKGSKGLGVDRTPKKRGRPKGSPNKKVLMVSQDEWEVNLLNGGASSRKKGRGRPKGSSSLKRKAERAVTEKQDDGSSGPPRKRGRPKGSLNKSRFTEERELSSEGESGTDLSYGNSSPPKRGRGRPKKHMAGEYAVSKEESDVSDSGVKPPQRRRGRPRKGANTSVQQARGSSTVQEPGATGGFEPPKRGRGRPKGSLNKRFPLIKVYSLAGRPRKIVPPSKVDAAAPTSETGKKRGRPRKETPKRGRPRKYPIPSPEEVKKPKVWKPLGRPRKYPRVDPPDGSASTPRRGRGRPRKSESKKGAHLRRSLLLTSFSLPRNPNGGGPRKRGRPSGSVKGENGTPRKRGRPKGSVNKNKAGNKTQLESTLSAKRPRHSKGKKGSAAEQGGYELEEEVEQNGDAGDTEATVVDEDRGFAPLDESDLSGSTEAVQN
ncbi:serine/arginine repetitive matrix protein 2-like [Lampris incognitus]|uniref:serine/arginine repetitive matrix protein 2-like n=1 Tax=Lampris incognitus TaxID=2546036 RepID=UPI0024B5F44B|nr:serine/arginine repetitive matrix protein 2-like [Lampris incognitus]